MEYYAIYRMASFPITLSDPGHDIFQRQVTGQELSYHKQIARQLRTRYVEGIYGPKYYSVQGFIQAPFGGESSPPNLATSPQEFLASSDFLDNCLY